uniref:VWFD domain-containing protein n=1 Tax=Biomphalaria glabrata TaxID=6526 RepID=A0A2C9LP09_BIOGL
MFSHFFHLLKCFAFKFLNLISSIPNYMRYQPKVMDLNTLHVYGQNECLMIEDTEADLHKHYVGCTKNPDHRQFILFKQFSLEHLPEGYRGDNDLFDLIVVTGNLTVRVDVKMTSPHRPDVWPGTSHPYPFYDLRGKTNMRLGSGRVSVLKFTNGCGSDGYGKEINIDGHKYSTAYQSCPCEKCQNSGSASQVWYEIVAKTATHVVFDTIEASHTTCKLFYDDHDSPVVILDKFQVYGASVEDDQCDMKYVTCDNELGEKLFNLVKRFFALTRKLYLQYKKRSYNTLCFIVSHPHGTTKQVSIGHWVDNCKVRDYNKNYNMTQLKYTTCTCPGSSGANVSCVGVSNIHFHSGAHLKGLNVSCAGFCSKRDMKIPPE